MISSLGTLIVAKDAAAILAAFGRLTFGSLIDGNLLTGSSAWVALVCRTGFIGLALYPREFTDIV